MQKLFVTFFLMAGTAYADTTVYPTGSSPADAQAVQAALDGGGKVLLKATNTAGRATAFVFGSTESVELHVDASLVGETTAAGTTTISGGLDTLQSFAPITVLVDGITFDHPIDDAVLFIGPSSITLTHNKVSHAVGYYRNPVHTYAEAFIASGGTVVIDDNVIDHVDAFVGTGVGIFFSSGPVEVRRNSVTGTSDSAIECTATGQTAITDNYLRPGDNEHHVAAYGIEVNGNGSYYVANNDVLVITPGGIGIWAFGTPGFGFGAMNAPVITHNHVVMQPNTTLFGGYFNDGIDLAGQVSNASITNNKIEGLGYSAFSLYALSFDPSDPSDLGHNTYVGNNISHVTATVADITLDTVAHDTVFRGFSGSVMDLGTNNAVTGFSHVSGTGAQVSAAVQARDAAAHVDRR